jgi:hypothetical protein
MFPLGFFDLVFWNQFCGSDLRAPFPFLLRVFPWGFDLVFWNQFVWGRDLRAPFPFPHLHMSWGFLSCVLESV